MKEIDLIRIIHQDRFTLGIMFNDKNYVCLTLELPWIDNEINKSCIMTGQYKAICNSSKCKYRLKEVPGRTAINIEIGNKITETKGCILVGLDFQKEFLYNSAPAFHKLLAIGEGAFILNIMNYNASLDSSSRIYSGIYDIKGKME